MKQSKDQSKNEQSDSVADKPTRKVRLSTATVKKYLLRRMEESRSSDGWANFILDCPEEGAECGRLIINSDFGNWSYFWASCGTDMRRFLISLDQQYLAHKFEETRSFVAEQTIINVKKDVLKARRDGAEKDWIRIVWKDVKWLDQFAYTCRTENDFYTQVCIEGLDALQDFYEGADGLPAVTSISPLFKRFWDECWLPFCNYLREELGEARK